MQLGWILSCIGHAILILALLFGGLFMGDRIPEPASVSEVSMVTEQEFAALALPGDAPDSQTDAPEIAAPQTEDAPEAPAADQAPSLPEPAPVEEPAEPDTSDIEVPQPIPNAVVVDTAPAIPAAPSEFDGTTLQPDQVAAPAPRVAPVPQVETPDVETAPDLVEDTAPDPEALPEDQPEPETAAAPEAASDRIVTEAEEEKTYAPASSRRPRSRPARRAQVAEPAEDPTPEPDQTETAAAPATEPADEAPVSRGPPLTGGEKDAFVVAVGDCWVIDSGGRSAEVKITVGFSLTREGKVEGNEVRLLNATGGTDATQRAAYDKARRAILRCQRGGYDLPAEKYEQWRDVEATFNPEGMQYR